MDVLKEAQHRAGKQIALWKVFTPFMLISGLLTLTALLCASTDIANQFAPQLIYIAGGSQLLAIFGGVTTYFITRKRPKLVRKQLEIAKAEEEADVLRFETTLVKHRDLIAQREVTTKQAIQAAYTRTLIEQREAFLKQNKAHLETLRKIEQPSIES